MSFGTFVIGLFVGIFCIAFLIYCFTFGFPIIIGLAIGYWLWQFGIIGQVIGGIVVIVALFLQCAWLVKMKDME